MLTHTIQLSSRHSYPILGLPTSSLCSNGIQPGMFDLYSLRVQVRKDLLNSPQLESVVAPSFAPRAIWTTTSVPTTLYCTANFISALFSCEPLESKNQFYYLPVTLSLAPTIDTVDTQCQIKLAWTGSSMKPPKHLRHILPRETILWVSFMTNHSFHSQVKFVMSATWEGSKRGFQHARHVLLYTLLMKFCFLHAILLEPIKLLQMGFFPESQREHWIQLYSLLGCWQYKEPTTTSNLTFYFLGRWYHVPKRTKISFRNGFNTCLFTQVFLMLIFPCCRTGVVVPSHGDGQKKQNLKRHTWNVS